jgi:hypothetical protein
LKETKAFSRELKLCDGRLDYNDKYHHHTYLIIQKRNARQGATKIMSDLISELWKRIIQIAQIENRPFLCCEFVPYFELDGGIYSIAYGTIAAVKSHRLEMISDSE